MTGAARETHRRPDEISSRRFLVVLFGAPLLAVLGLYP
jgi:hypothetical protein